MRGLVMDFAGDRKAWNIDDQYLFGPAFLVAPVSEYKARSRKVYLPAGANWYDFATGAALQGRPDRHRRRALRAHAVVRPRRRGCPDRSRDPAPASGPIGRSSSTSSPAPTAVLALSGRRISREYQNGKFERIPLRWDEARSADHRRARRWLSGDAGASGSVKVRCSRPGRPRRWQFQRGRRGQSSMRVRRRPFACARPARGLRSAAPARTGPRGGGKFSAARRRRARNAVGPPSRSTRSIAASGKRGSERRDRAPPCGQSSRIA